jgi:hypothetical protein
MAGANPLWGAPRIHGELRKLGIEISERTVSRLLAQLSRPPSQPWRTFLAYAKSMASRDDFSDSLCLLCSDTANLHQHALVGCNDMLYCAELKQQAIRQSWTDAR